MEKQNTSIPEHLNYLTTLVKSYESYFRKNMGSVDINIGEIPILLAIYMDEGLNQIDLVKKFHVTEANISKTSRAEQLTLDDFARLANELLIYSKETSDALDV